MTSAHFFYSNGVPIDEGDAITVIKKHGSVDRIFAPKTDDAKDFCCFDTGGILLRFEDGDLQVWPHVNEDLVLLKKKAER